MHKIASNYPDDDEYDDGPAMIAAREAMRRGKSIMVEFEDGVMTHVEELPDHPPVRRPWWRRIFR